MYMCKYIHSCTLLHYTHFSQGNAAGDWMGQLQAEQTAIWCRPSGYSEYWHQWDCHQANERAVSADGWTWVSWRWPWHRWSFLMSHSRLCWTRAHWTLSWQIWRRRPFSRWSGWGLRMVMSCRWSVTSSASPWLNLTSWRKQWVTSLGRWDSQGTPSGVPGPGIWSRALVLLAHLFLHHD